MARVRRWPGEAQAEYRRHPRWAAAGLSVIAVALRAAGTVWVMRRSPRRRVTPDNPAPGYTVNRS